MSGPQVAADLLLDSGGESDLERPYQEHPVASAIHGIAHLGGDIKTGGRSGLAHSLEPIDQLGTLI